MNWFRALMLFSLYSLMLGCQKPSTTSSPSPSLSQTPAQSSRLDQAIERGLAFLTEQQHEDGAWRSKVVEPFKDGPSLTPLVLKVFVYAPDQLAGARAAQIREAGQKYLGGVDDDALKELAFPVYSVALGVAVLPQGEQRQRWVQFVRSHQLTEALGWSVDDPEFGGWGESLAPYRKPDEPEPEKRANFASPNISNTLFALAALRLAGVPADDPAVQKAKSFVQRCQNFPEDGGFFYSPVNLTQNKAGERNSYGSTTADGLRALALCGVDASDERRRVAVDWLQQNFDAEQVPGLKPDSALYFYYAWSLGHAWRYFERPPQRQADELSQHLLGLQRPDGSWSNSNPQMTENDPLVATSMALAVLLSAREAKK